MCHKAINQPSLIALWPDDNLQPKPQKRGIAQEISPGDFVGGHAIDAFQ